MNSLAMKWPIRIGYLLILAGCGWIPANEALAQATTGSIYGSVSDESGAMIQNASVAAIDTHTGKISTAMSDASGNYTFLVLPPSDYQIGVRARGFESQTQTGVRLDANQNVHVNFTLRLSSTEQSVTVAATTTLVDTREAQIGATVDQKRIEDLPLNGRNAYDLVQILPGVTNYAPDTQTGSRVGTQFSVNGLGTGDTAFYLDGAYDTQVWQFGGNLIPNPDALQEFRVLTNNFDAEFGRSPGGVVNVITRSGSNQFHGLAYDYLRNDVLNAKNYFISTVTPLRQNQFGGNLGGPIAHNKEFFFLSYQGMRFRTPVIIPAGSVATPTPQEASGDFRLATTVPNVSCNGVHGVICPSMLDPVAQNLLELVPLADPKTGETPQQSTNGNINADQYMGRFDYQLKQKHQLSGLYFMSRGTSNYPTIGGNQILDYAGDRTYEGQYNGVASDTWLISASKVNSLRLFYSLNHYIISNIYGTDHLLASFGSQAGEGTTEGLNSQPQFAINGYWTMGVANNSPSDMPSTSLGVSDTFNWLRGNHEVKAGGSFIWDRYRLIGGGRSNGLFGFTGSTTGNAMADLLLGHANTLAQNSGVNYRLHSPDPSVFAQDNWRVTRRLTLNLGLRWEYYPLYTGQNNVGTFVPYVQSKRFPAAPLGLLTSGDPGIPDGIMHTPWNTFAPRFGFAYDVFGDGRTSVRGAYGNFYAAVDVNQISNNMQQQPFALAANVAKTPNLVNPYSPDPDPFPFTFNPENPVFTSGAQIYSLPPRDKRIPYGEEYHLTLQQQYGAKWSMQIAYIGNVSHRLYVSHDINSPIFVPGAAITTAGLNSRRPYQPTSAIYTFGIITQFDPIGNSSYNSLQATVTRQFDRRFSLLASYVWSRGIGYGPPVNSYELSSSRGLLTTDLPQAFVASYIYALPDVHRWGFMGKGLLGGWQLNGITTLQTGQPFNVTSGVDTNLDGVTTDRPNTVGNPILPGGRALAATVHEFFNTAAFAQVPKNVPYGNTQYDSLIGPGYFDTDLSAFKDFPIYRESTLQFRAEAFNAFNRVNLNQPNSVLTSPLFGSIGGADPSRILQFALRISF